MQSTSAYIVDADRESRINLHRLLSARGLQTRSFVSGEDFLVELPHLSPGVVLIDVANAGENGFDVIKDVARSTLACAIIAMTEAADVHVAVAAIRRGAVDFLIKPVDEEELQAALLGTAGILERRRVIFDQVRADEILLSRLTSRETEVLELVAEGLVNKEIASKLQIGVRTVEAHRTAIAQKMGASNSAAAVAIFARHRAALHSHDARILAAIGS